MLQKFTWLSNCKRNPKLSYSLSFGFITVLKERIAQERFKEGPSNITPIRVLKVGQALI